MEACVAAGLDLERWLLGQIDNRVKAATIAWYRLKRAIEANVNDAQEAEMKRKSGRGAR